MVSDLEALISVLRQRNSKCTILLAQIIPVAGGVSKFVELNRLIPGVASKLSNTESKVVVVDQFKDFDPEVDTYDAVHPTPEGEKKIANKWFEALATVLR